MSAWVGPYLATPACHGAHDHVQAISTRRLYMACIDYTALAPSMENER